MSTTWPRVRVERDQGRRTHMWVLVQERTDLNAADRSGAFQRLGIPNRDVLDRVLLMLAAQADALPIWA